MTQKGNMRDLAVLTQQGMKPVEAAKKAGFDVGERAANELARQAESKFKTKIQQAYETVGVDALKIAETHRDIIDNGKDADRLKAVDQVLDIMDVKQKDNNAGGITFEQAIINITNTVNLQQVDHNKLRQALIEGEFEPV